MEGNHTVESDYTGKWWSGGCMIFS